MGDVSSIPKGPLDFPQCTENGDVVVGEQGKRIPFNQYYPPTIEDLPDNSPAQENFFADLFSYVDESPTVPIRFGRSVVATAAVVVSPLNLLASCEGGYISDADKDKDDDTFSFCIEGDAVDECDCDDGRSDVHPDAAEVCDEVDNDCDGSIDEGVQNTYYLDTDGDKYGDPANPSKPACSAPEGYVDNADDCDDSDPSLNPETFWHEDFDGDAYGNADVWQQQCSQPEGFVADAEDCDDDDPAVNPLAIEVCNNIDDDCNGLVDELPDSDGDGYILCDDCDDTNGSINPGAAEYCNGVDDNCDGFIDEESALDATVWYPDVDGNNLGIAGATILACNQPLGGYASVTDLVGWWKFDEGSGSTVVDSSGNGNDGMLMNGSASSMWASGVDGTSLSLHGNDYVEVSDDNTLDSPQTFSLWFYTATGDGSFIDKYDGSNIVGGGYHLEAGSASGGFAWRVSDFCCDFGSIPFVLNEWNHVIVVHQPGSQTFYLNGQEMAATTYANGPVDNVLPLVFGANANYQDLDGDGIYEFTPYEFFDDTLMDEIAFYNRALSADEVLESCQQDDPTGTTCQP